MHHPVWLWIHDELSWKTICLFFAHVVAGVFYATSLELLRPINVMYFLCLHYDLDLLICDTNYHILAFNLML